MKKNLLALVVCAFLVIGVVGCGNSADDGGASSKPLSETMTIDELNAKTQENNDVYKSYLGKKIKITGLEVYDNKIMSSDKLVTVNISCSNGDSLDIKTGDKVSVTGVVNETWTSMYSYSLENCTIEK